MVTNKKDLFTITVIIVMSVVLLLSGRFTGKYAASKYTEEWLLSCDSGDDLGREVVKLVGCRSFSLDRVCSSLASGKLNKGVTLVWDKTCNYKQIDNAINVCQNVVNSMCKKG